MHTSLLLHLLGELLLLLVLFLTSPFFANIDALIFSGYLLSIIGANTSEFCSCFPFPMLVVLCDEILLRQMTFSLSSYLYHCTLGRTVTEGNAVGLHGQQFVLGKVPAVFMSIFKIM